MIELALVLQQIADQVGSNARNIGKISDSVDAIVGKFDRSNALLDHMLVRIEKLEKQPNVNTDNITKLAASIEKVNTLLSDHCERIDRLEKPKKSSSDIAPRSSGEGDSLGLKPFVGTLRVANPVR